MDLKVKNRFIIYIGSALSFTIPLLFYLKGLAPSVTLEDSGEFITAAFHFGIPHPPGYPLYTILSGLFLKIPFLLDSPAWKMNLFSALTFSLSGIFIFLSFIHFIEDQNYNNRTENETFTQNNNRNSNLEIELQFTDLLFGITASTLALLTPHVFRQAVITEVYGLHNLIWALGIFILTSLLSNAQKFNSQIYIYLFFLTALGLTNHPLMIGFLFLIFSLYPYLFKNFVINRKNIFYITVAFICGLIPLVYLPLRASYHPVLNWGETNNFNNFISHILRDQYAPQFFRNIYMLTEQIREQIIYLFEQFYLELIIVGISGLTLLFYSNRKKWFYFFLFNLICTGPLIAVLTNFSLNFGSQIDYEETSSLNSVFYLVHYQAWGLLITVAILQFLNLFKNKIFSRIVASSLLILSLFLGYKTLQQEDKSQDLFAEQNLHNLEVLFNNMHSSTDLSIPEGKNPSDIIGVVITNWDPFSFPMIYFQNVQNRSRNIIVIDVEMLKSSWYIHQIQYWYPEFTKQFSYEFKTYLDELASFKSDHKEVPFKSYFAMIEKIIHFSVYANIPTLLMIDREYFKLPPINLNNYFMEPAFVGSLIRKKSDFTTLNIPVNQFSFEGFERSSVKYDRLHKMLARYYATLLVEKAELEMVRNPKEYDNLLGLALKITKEQPLFENKIKKRHSL